MMNKQRYPKLVTRIAKIREIKKRPMNMGRLYKRKLCLFGFSFHRLTLFLDTGAFTATLTLVVQLSATNTTYLMQQDGLDVGREEGEQTLHTYAIGNFTYGEGGSSTIALYFNYIAFEGLDTLLVTFNDFIVNGDIVTGFEFGVFLFTSELLVHKLDSGLHNFNFKDGKDKEGGGTFGKLSKENLAVSLWLLAVSLRNSGLAFIFS